MLTFNTHAVSRELIGNIDVRQPTSEKVTIIAFMQSLSVDFKGFGLHKLLFR